MRLTRRGEVAVALLFAVAVTLAVTRFGFGGSSGSPDSAPSVGHTPSASTYARVLQRIASSEATAQQEVAEAFASKSLPTLRQAMQTFAAEQAGLATQLAALMPPRDAVDANTALATALADSAAAAHSLIDRVARVNSVTKVFYVFQSDRETARVGKAIGAALKQLRALGYLPQPTGP